MEAMAVKAIAFLHFVINNKTMRNSLFLLLALIILSFASCSKPVEPKPEEVAGRAAKASTTTLYRASMMPMSMLSTVPTAFPPATASSSS